MSNEKNEKERLWSLQYLLLFIINLFGSLGFFFTSPIVSKYASSIGATLSLAGVVSGLFSTTAMIVRPISGFLTDKLSKKNLLVISTAAITVSLFGYALASNLVVFCVFRFLHGFFYGISGTVTHASVASVVPKSRMGEGVSIFAFVGTAASAIGPSIAVELLDVVGFKNLFLMAGTMVGISCVLAIIYKAPKNDKPAGKKNIKDMRIADFIAVSAIPLAIVSGLFSMTNGVISTFLVQLGDARGIANISLYFTVKAAALMVIRFLLSKIVDKTKLSFIYYPAVAFEIVTMILLARANVLGAVIVAAVAKSLGQGIGQPAIQAEIFKRSDPALVGVATSTYYLASDAGQGFGPMLAGVLLDHMGYEEMFVAFAVIMALGAVFYTLFVRKSISTMQ